MKTSELKGIALDWAVAKCEGVKEDWCDDGPFLWDGVPCIRIGGHDVNYRPSTEWYLAGPIIEREMIDIQCLPTKQGGFIWRTVNADGPTPLIAAMRCYVASKMGDDIEIPTELTKGESK